MAKTFVVQFVDLNDELLVENHGSVWDAETRAIELIQCEYFTDPVIRFPDDEGIIRLEISTSAGWKPVASVQEESR